MRKWISEPVILTTFIGVIIIIFLACIASNLLDEKHSDEIVLIGALATVAIFLGAFHQLRQVNKMQKTELFFKIAAQFKDPNIINARRIIHELFVEHYRIANPYKDDKEKRFAYYFYALDLIANDINSMSKSKKDIEDFCCLLRWLEFLEMLGYFYHEEVASKKHIEQLFPETIEFQYFIFRKYLEGLSGERFKYFIKMYESINRKKVIVDENIWREFLAGENEAKEIFDFLKNEQMTLCYDWRIEEKLQTDERSKIKKLGEKVIFCTSDEIREILKLAEKSQDLFACLHKIKESNKVHDLKELNPKTKFFFCRKIS
tara:strand:+ start:77 stop:1027 length:951 start_codon:yes stop_codon:yes gene_type:complete